MDVSWCAAHESVGLLYHCSNIQVVTMVEEILQKRRDRKVHYVSKFVFFWIRLDEMMGKVPQSLASVSRGGEAHGNR